MWAALSRLRAEHPGQTVAVVTHGDVIRAVLAQVTAAPVELVLRSEIGPAAVPAIELHDRGPCTEGRRAAR